MNAPQRRGVLGRMTAGLGTSQPPRISIRAQRFSLVDTAGNEMLCNLVDPQLGYYLDVIIVDANENKSKIFYGRDYNPDNDDPPLCWSDNGVAPSVDASTPQSPTCAVCPNNELGSAISKFSGKRIKACQDRKKLALLVIGDPHRSLYSLPISPGSLSSLRGYADFIGRHPSPSGQGSADVSDVVTRLSFDPQAQGVLLFNANTPIAPDMVAVVAQIYESGAADAIVGRNDRPIQGMLPPPAGQAPAQLAPPPPQPAYTPPPAPPPQQAFQQQPPAPQTAPAPGKRGGARAGAGRRPAQAEPAGNANGAFSQATGQQGQGAPFQPQAAHPVAPAAPPVGAGNVDPAMPAFLQRQQPAAPAPAPTAPAAPTAPQPAFGMAPAAPPPPSADMSAALDRAFGAPLPRR